VNWPRPPTRRASGSRSPCFCSLRPTRLPRDGVRLEQVAEAAIRKPEGPRQDRGEADPEGRRLLSVDAVQGAQERVDAVAAVAAAEQTRR
jgi:hypothetical protein